MDVMIGQQQQVRHCRRTAAAAADDDDHGDQLASLSLFLLFRFAGSRVQL